jgi:hypothetical protein
MGWDTLPSTERAAFSRAGARMIGGASRTLMIVSGPVVGSCYGSLLHPRPPVDHELRGNLKLALTGRADERGSPLDRIFSDVHVKQIIVEHVVTAIFREKIRKSRLGICRD